MDSLSLATEWAQIALPNIFWVVLIHRVSFTFWGWTCAKIESNDREFCTFSGVWAHNRCWNKKNSTLILFSLSKLIFALIGVDWEYITLEIYCCFSKESSVSCIRFLCPLPFFCLFLTSFWCSIYLFLCPKKEKETLQS